MIYLGQLCGWAAGLEWSEAHIMSFTSWPLETTWPIYTLRLHRIGHKQQHLPFPLGIVN